MDFCVLLGGGQRSNKRLCTAHNEHDIKTSETQQTAFVLQTVHFFGGRLPYLTQHVHSLSTTVKDGTCLIILIMAFIKWALQRFHT